MKKNIKKFLGVFLSALLIMLPILYTNVEKVEAEDVEKSCKDFTNYYFFLHVVNYDTTFAGEIGSYPITRTHTSSFLTELPDNLNLGENEDKFEKTWIDIGAGQEGWDKNKWWKIYMEKLGGELTEGGFVEKDGNTWYYAHVLQWFLEGEQPSTGYTTPMKYTLKENVDSTFTTATTDGTYQVFNLANRHSNTMDASIQRTITSKWDAFAAEQATRKNADGNHPTDKHIWMPGLLKVTYQAECVEEEPEFNLTLHYEEDGTEKVLQDPKLVGTYPEGETYNATCPNTIGNYTLTRDSGLTGTMPANDVDEYCYYKLNEEEPIVPPEDPKDPEDPTYKVTVNYLDKNTLEPIRNPYTHPTVYKNGDKYQAECPDGFDAVYILDSHSGNLNGSIAGKDVVVNCLYVTKSAPTSDIPIYIVWGVGGAALAYSVYYFRKYYKQENNA